MASGDTLWARGAQGFVGYGSNPAELSQVAGTNVDIPVYLFDQTTDEEVIALFYMPDNYANGGITVTVVWGAVSVTTGNGVWQVAFMSITDDADDLDTKAFAAFNTTGAVTTPSAAGEYAYDTVTFTDGADMDSVTAGEFAFVKVRRDADDTSATDNIAEDLRLLGLIIKET